MERFYSIAKIKPVSPDDYDSLPILFFEIRDLIMSRYNRVANK